MSDWFCIRCGKDMNPGDKSYMASLVTIAEGGAHRDEPPSVINLCPVCVNDLLIELVRKSTKKEVKCRDSTGNYHGQ